MFDLVSGSLYDALIRILEESYTYWYTLSSGKTILCNVSYLPQDINYHFLKSPNPPHRIMQRLAQWQQVISK
jgi:hypothetical protein